MIKNGEEVCCPECGFNMMHNIDVVCMTAQDGDNPHRSVRITQIKDENGKSNLAVSQCDGPSLSFESTNRVREMDIFARFWCEGCGGIVGLGLTFHKGVYTAEFRVLELEKLFIGEKTEMIEASIPI